MDKYFRNHIYKIVVINWISSQPFEQPGSDNLFLLAFHVMRLFSFFIPGFSGNVEQSATLDSLQQQ